MAAKTSKAAPKQMPAPKSGERREVTFREASEPEKAAAMARMALRPSVNAAAVMVTYTKPLGDQDFGSLVDSLSAGMDEVWAGDMKQTEAMLYGQAHALQAIFMFLARRAAAQEYLKQWEAYLRMALKAQNQCRMTLETLAVIKNPPVVITKQANINNGGQQQVNNGVPVSTVVNKASGLLHQANAVDRLSDSASSVDTLAPTIGAETPELRNLAR